MPKILDGPDTADLMAAFGSDSDTDTKRRLQFQGDFGKRQGKWTVEMVIDALVRLGRRRWFLTGTLYPSVGVANGFPVKGIYSTRTRKGRVASR